MNEQEKLALRKRFREMGPDECLFEMAVRLIEFSSPDRPPCNRIKRLMGNGRLGLVHWQYLWLAGVTVGIFGKDYLPLLVRFFATFM